MENRKYHIIPAVILVVLAIITSFSLHNFVQVKGYINNFDEKKIQNLFLACSENRISQSCCVNGLLHFDTQKELDASMEIFIHRLLDAKKGLFDSNTITFLITLVVVMLAGYLLSTQEKIRILSDQCQNDLRNNSKHIQSIEEKNIQIDQLEKRANNLLETIASQERISAKNKNEFEKQVTTINKLINQYSLLHKVEILYGNALRLQPVLESQKHIIKSSDNNILSRIDKCTTDLINDIKEAKYYYVSKDLKKELIETIQNTIYIFKMEKDSREIAELSQSRILNYLLNNLDDLLQHVNEINCI